MTRLLVDTSAYSAAARGHGEAGFILQHADEIYLNSVVLAELLSGFRHGNQRAKNERELRRFLGSPRVALVDVDALTAEHYASIHDSLRSLGKPIPTNDLWIAASAMQHGLDLLTTDTHFKWVTHLRVAILAVGR